MAAVPIAKLKSLIAANSINPVDLLTETHAVLYAIGNNTASTAPASIKLAALEILPKVGAIREYLGKTQNERRAANTAIAAALTAAQADAFRNAVAAATTAALPPPPPAYAAPNAAAIRAIVAAEPNITTPPPLPNHALARGGRRRRTQRRRNSRSKRRHTRR